MTRLRLPRHHGPPSPADAPPGLGEVAVADDEAERPCAQREVVEGGVVVEGGEEVGGGHAGMSTRAGGSC